MKKKELGTVADLLAKIDWEGGLYDAFILHGIKLSDYDLPDDIKFRLDDAVEDYETATQELEAILDELQDLAEPLEDEDE